MPKENLRELIVGAAAAVATPFDENYEVDLGKMYDLTQWWVANGLIKGNGIIKVAAAAGEGPMLDDPEWAALLRTTVQASGGKATVMCGLHYKDTKRTIRDAKVAQDMGAHALQVCPPIFNDPSQNDLLDYYGDLSDAIDIGIMVYHTHWLKGGRIETDTLLRMADFENVVAIKWSPHDGQVYEDMAKFVDRFNIIDNTVNPVRCAQHGGHGFVQTSVEAYPPHDLKVWELIQGQTMGRGRGAVPQRAGAAAEIRREDRHPFRRPGKGDEGHLADSRRARRLLPPAVQTAERRGTAGASRHHRGLRLAHSCALVL